MIGEGERERGSHEEANHGNMQTLPLLVPGPCLSRGTLVISSRIVDKAMAVSADHLSHESDILCIHSSWKKNKSTSYCTCGQTMPTLTKLLSKIRSIPAPYFLKDRLISWSKTVELLNTTGLIRHWPIWINHCTMLKEFNYSIFRIRFCFYNNEFFFMLILGYAWWDTCFVFATINYGILSLFVIKIWVIQILYLYLLKKILHI